MGGAGARCGEHPDVVVVEVHGVRVPDVRARPSQRLHVLHGPATELLEAEVLFVEGLGEMGVQPDSEIAGEQRRLPQQIAGDRER